MKPARLIQPVLTCLATCVALAQQGAAPALPDEVDVPEVKEPWDWKTGRGVDPLLMERLNQLVPPGRAHEGLSYPIYSERTETLPAQRKSLFETARMLRLDANHLRFKDAVFVSYGDEKQPELPTRTVKMADMVYDLQHDLVFSSAPVRIDDEEMRIHSGNVLHDRATGLTIFDGGVELYFAEPEPAPPAAAPAPAPAAPPSPAPAKP
jgi:hypothetical protein